MQEEQSRQLSATVDKLLAESQERLQTHYREKMLLIDERNKVFAEADRSRKLAHELDSEKVRFALSPLQPTPLSHSSAPRPPPRPPLLTAPLFSSCSSHSSHSFLTPNPFSFHFLAYGTLHSLWVFTMTDF